MTGRFLVTGGSGFIGTNLISRLLREGNVVLNVDRASPIDPDQVGQWCEMDVCNVEQVSSKLLEFQPDVIVHLAGKTDLDSAESADYECNPAGLKSLLSGLRALSSPFRLIVASTMLVNRLGVKPDPTGSLEPLPGYGESKAKMEEILRQENEVFWTIVRPTTIWGPWHLRWSREFLSRIILKKYWHPARDCTRSYGYVGNVVQELIGIAIASSEDVRHKTFYVGDPPIPLSQFVDAFYSSYHRKPAPRLPYAVLKCVAIFGDVIGGLGIRFPLTSFRLRNMVTDNIIDVTAVRGLGSQSWIELDEAVSETKVWFESMQQLKSMKANNDD